MPQGQYPTVNAGTDYTAGLIQGFAPLHAWKTSDTSRPSTTTLTNDPDLFINVAANATYRLDGFLSYTGDATGSGGLKWAWAAPAGATLADTALFFQTGISAAGLRYPVEGFAVSDSAVTNGGVQMPVIIWGTLTTSTTAGTFSLQWCQNASDAVATTLKAGSRLTLTRMA